LSNATGSGPAKAVRRLGAPVRRFFNDHFTMVKQEIWSARDQVIGTGFDIVRLEQQVATSAEKIEESAGFLGMRLGRLVEQQEDLATAFQQLQNTLQDPTTTAWPMFVAHSLRNTSCGRVMLLDPRAGLIDALELLGYAVQDGPSDSQGTTAEPCDAAIAPWTGMADPLAPAIDQLRDGATVVTAGKLDPDGSLPSWIAARLHVEQQVLAAGRVFLCGHLQQR